MESIANCKDCKHSHLCEDGQWWPDDYLCEIGGWFFPWWGYLCSEFEFNERALDGP